MNFLEIFMELSLIIREKNLLLSLVDYHVKRAVHSCEILEYKSGRCSIVQGV
jgi:hypothetical protein